MTKTGTSVERDLHYLSRALTLASLGENHVAPNPLVGAVIVNNGYIVGEGFHVYNGIKHAEVLALERAGKLARGATVYINIEPCCHSGAGKRTPPCIEALIEAKVERVVCCTQDPNPRVAGKGFAALRGAGISVSLGLKAEVAYRLNAEYFGFISHRDSQITSELLSPATTIYGPIRFPVPALAREIQQFVPRIERLF